MTEKSIQNAILRTFATRSDMRLWRANTGVARYGKRTVRFGVPGQADLTGLLPVTLVCPACGVVAGSFGVRLEIEAKKPGGVQTTEQQQYERMIKRFGGIYVTAYSVQDVWDAIGGHLNVPRSRYRLLACEYVARGVRDEKGGRCVVVFLLRVPVADPAFGDAGCRGVT